MSKRKLADKESNTLLPGEEHYRSYVGPPQEFDLIGASQFRLLTTLGLREHHKVLDFGCGSLRAGKYLIPYLETGNYVGLEPNKWLIDDGIERQIGNDMIRIKNTKFYYDDDFHAEKCGNDFDFILAQSIFSHSGKDVILLTLNSFYKAISATGLILATFIIDDKVEEREYKGWIYPGCITYSSTTINGMIASSGLVGRPIPFFHPRQTWYVLAKDESRIPPIEYDIHLKGVILNVESWGTCLTRI